MRSSKLKTALKTFFVISLVSILAYVGVCFGLYFTLAANDFANLLANYVEVIKRVVGAFIYPFLQNHAYATLFADVYKAIGVNPLIISITVLAASGLIFIFFILGLIRVFSKGKPAFCLYTFALIALSFIIANGLSGESLTAFNFVKAFSEGSLKDVLTAVLALCVLIFSGLALISVIVTYILGWKYAGVKKQLEEVKEEEQEESQPVLAEENLAPEEVMPNDEPVAELTQDFIPTVEPEPEPELEQPEEDNKEEVVNNKDEVVEEPEEIDYVEPEPIPEPQPDETNNHVEVNVNNNPAPQAQNAGIDPNSLASLLREVVRDIVRDEIARNNANQPQFTKDESKGGNQTITGATFGGPLVVQYFNGGINGVTPAQAQEEKPAPVKEVIREVVKEEVKEPVKEEPVKEEPAPAPVVEAKPEPAPAPAPVVEAAPAPVPVQENQEEKPVYERLSFAERLLQADQEILDLYNELKNEILSYGVKSRISAVGDTFRLHKKMYVRITVAGKSLKLYFALNPDDYKDSKIPVQDAGHKGLYAEIPLVFKVRSGLSIRRCKELIQDVMEKDGLEQGEIGKVNWAKELKAEMKQKASGKNDEDDD